MTYFSPRDGVLCAEGVPLPVIAEAVGKPVHVYSAPRCAMRRTGSALSILPGHRIALREVVKRLGGEPPILLTSADLDG